MKTLDFSFDGTDYTLCFNRKTVKQMEQAGFAISRVDNMPTVMMEMLFKGAFLARHPKVKDDVLNDAWIGTPDKQGLVEALAEMYGDTMNAFMDDPSEENTKKAVWVKNF